MQEHSKVSKVGRRRESTAKKVKLAEDGSFDLLHIQGKPHRINDEVWNAPGDCEAVKSRSGEDKMTHRIVDDG